MELQKRISDHVDCIDKYKAEKKEAKTSLYGSFVAELDEPIASHD